MYEFDLYLQGQAKAVERQKELAAWHAANLMNMWAKKGRSVTADKLLGRQTEEAPSAKVQRQSVEARRQERREVRAKRFLADVTGQTRRRAVAAAEADSERARWMAGLVDE